MCAVWKWCCLALFHCVKVFHTSVRRVSSYADILCSVEHSLLAFRARSSKLQVASSIWFSLKKYFKPNLRRLLSPTAYYGMKMEPFYPGRVLNLKKTRAKTNILMIHVDSNNMRRVYECYNSKIENVRLFIQTRLVFCLTQIKVLATCSETFQMLFLDANCAQSGADRVTE